MNAADLPPPAINQIDPLAILNARGKNLDSTHYGYKLAGNDYGLDIAFSEELNIDESKMSAWIPFADGKRRDGVGDLLEVGGIRTERHRFNPIVLFDHGKSVSIPIGMAAERDGDGKYDFSKYTVVIDPVQQVAKLNCFFYQGKTLNGKSIEHAIFVEQLYDMLAKRLLGAGSVGYQVIQARPIQADYEQGTPQGLHLLSVRMLEGSLVVLPANQDTVRKCLAMPQVCGKPLSPYLIKSLTPYAGENTKTVSGYEGKGYVNNHLYATKVGEGGKRKPSYRIEGEGGMKYGLFWEDGTPLQGNSGGLDSKEVRQAIENISAKSLEEKRGPEGEYCPHCDARLERGDDGNCNTCGKPWPEKSMKADSKFIAPVEVITPRFTVARLEQAYYVMDRGQNFLGPFDAELIAKEKADECNRMFGTKDIPVPLRDVRNGPKIPPAKWKPGAGAVKGGQLGEPRNTATGFHESKLPRTASPRCEPNGDWYVRSRNEKVAGPFKSEAEAQRAADDWMRSNKTLKSGVGAKKKGYNFPDGWPDDWVRDFDREVSSGRVSGVTKQDMDDENDKYWNAMDRWGEQRATREGHHSLKSMDILRKKYRTSAKGLRRRLKKSSPGFSTVHVNNKDLESLKEQAKQKGVKLQWMGGTSKKGVDKVKLSGDDEVIDELAKNFGRKMKSIDTTNKGKSMKNIKTKDLPPVDAGAEVDTTADVVEEKLEPLSAQVHRRMHQDFGILMKDYDELMKLLEHEPTKVHLQSILEQLEENLSATEELFGEHHGDELDPLEGADEKAMDGEEEEVIDTDVDDDGDVDAEDVAAVADDAAEEAEPPTAEEAVEGMQKEDDDDKENVKSLRSKYKKKTLKDDDEKKKEKEKDKKEEKYLKKSVCPKCEKAGKKECKCDEKSLKDDDKKDKEKKDDKKEDKSIKSKKKDFNPLEDESEQDIGGEGLSQSEKSMVGEAAGYLGEVASTNNFGEEHRQKAYHYHRTMRGIGDIMDMADDAMTDDPMKSVKSNPDGPYDPNTDEPIKKPYPDEIVDDMKSHRKMCKDASGFFGELSTERAFGDTHREKAATWHRALIGITKEDNPEGETESDERIGGVEPGEMGEKTVNRLKGVFVKVIQNQKELEKKLLALSNGKR